MAVIYYPQVFSLVLIASCFLNVILLYYQIALRDVNSTITRYAGLSRNVSTLYYSETDYSGHDEHRSYELWYGINIDLGVIALDDTYAQSKGIVLEAERFPWDSSKGVYILHGFHNLHCLKIIFISLWEYRNGEEQSRKRHHISHCLDALRRQVICDADDTPRPVRQTREGVSGVGQYRSCRNWDDLEAFAKRHTACYQRPDKPIENMPNIEKYKHCPEGSEYVISTSL